jgi:signal transduction histidine kinase
MLQRARASVLALIDALEPRRGSPERRRRGRLLAVMLLCLWGAAVVALLNELARHALFGEYLPEVYLVSTAGLMGFPVLMAGNRAGRTRVVSVAFLVLVTVLILLSDTPVEVVNGRSTFFLVLPPVMASVLLAPGAALVGMGLIAVLLGILSIGPTPYPVLPLLGMSVLTVVSWLAARSMEKALTRLAASNEELERRVRERARELEEARELLVQTEKIRLASSFAAGVAHEVNNSLSIVRSNLEVLRADTGLLDQGWRALRLAVEMLEDAPAEVQQRLALGLDDATTQSLAEHRETIEDIELGVERIATLVQGFHKLNLPLEPRERAPVVVQELLSDCLEAMPDGGAPTLVAGETAVVLVAGRDLRAAVLELCRFFAGQGQQGQAPRITVHRHPLRAKVRIEITCPVSHMSEQERLSIFDPRLQVDERADGAIRLDLGMALAYQLVLRNQGTLSVTQGGGEGLAFRIELPACDA